MQIEYTGRQTGVTARLRAMAERRLSKLARLLGRVTRAHVILTADKHRQIAEVSLHARNLDLSAQDETADMQTSLGRVIDKLERQVQRHTGKRQERKRRAPARSLGAAPAAPERRPPARARAARKVTSRRAAARA